MANSRLQVNEIIGAYAEQENIDKAYPSGGRGDVRRGFPLWGERSAAAKGGGFMMFHVVFGFRVTQ